MKVLLGTKAIYPAHIVNLAGSIFDDTRYYNSIASVVNQPTKLEHGSTNKGRQHRTSSSSPDDCCIKINVDATRSHRSCSTAIASSDKLP